MTYYDYLSIATYGLGAGFAIGFISWGIGFVVYSIIGFFKMAS